MSELIEKQKVLDALREIATEKFSLDDPYGVYINVLIDVEEKICRLPVVQPNGPDNLVKDSQGLAKDLVNDCISRQAAIDALGGNEPVGDPSKMDDDDVVKMWERIRIINIINKLPSAQPECAKDFVMLKVIDLNGRPYYSIIYLENGNEFEGYSSYDLKVISEYLKRYFGFAQPERQKGEWIDYTEDGYVECPFCHSATNCDGNKDELHFCFSCGADMREVDE